MLVKISDSEALYVTTCTLRQAYINCVKQSKSIHCSSDEREKYLDLSVGFPIVLKYFLSEADYFDFMEHTEEEINNEDTERVPNESDGF